MELSPAIGVGASDLQHAVRAEVQRILEQTKGNEAAQSRLLLRMLRERGLITTKEVTVLQRQAEIGIRAGAARRGNANKAYAESRDIYNSLLTTTQPSPVALAIASSAVGSYSTDDTGGGGSGTVVYKKNSGGWQGRGATIGAAVGAIWGPAGAAIGAAVGGAVGEAVDECTK
jgi:hypothetical protein